MEYRPYSRRVNYYETDQMAIVHHSNYIRWFEEARLDFLDQVGLNYREMEKTGLIVPVVDVSCRYHVSAKYDDLMDIYAYLTSFNGVRMDYRYEVRFHEQRRSLRRRHLQPLLPRREAPPGDRQAPGSRTLRPPQRAGRKKRKSLKKRLAFLETIVYNNEASYGGLAQLVRAHASHA